MRLVRVAVPVPALDSLTYSLPAAVQTPAVGARVLVPLGNRVLTGCVVERTEAGELPPSTIKPIIEVLDTEAFLPEEVVRLATWVADYYACGIGSALAAAMPPMAAATEPGGRARGFRTVRVASLTAQGLDVTGERTAALRLGPRQREALTLLAGAPEGLETAHLTARGIAAPALSRLADAGSRDVHAAAESIAIRSTRTVRVALPDTPGFRSDGRTGRRARPAALARRSAASFSPRSCTASQGVERPSST